MQEARSRAVEEKLKEAFGALEADKRSHWRPRVEEGRGRTSDAVLSGGSVGRDCRGHGRRQRPGRVAVVITQA